jgi:hypothetical protein
VRFQRLVYLSGHRIIRCRRNRGFHVGNQMWQRCVATLGEMDFVADPRGAPLLRVTRLEVVG